MRLFIALLVLLATSATVQANDAEELVTFGCGGCHGDEMYTRENRVTQSIQQLTQRVNGCNHVAHTQWSDEQIADVIDYLNKTYYHFN